MNPNRRSRDPPSGQDQENAPDQGLSSIWNSLGRLRAELRRMEHRLDSAGEAGLSSGSSGGSISTNLFPSQFHSHRLGAPAGAVSMPGISVPYEQSQDAAKVSAPLSPHHSGSRRKVSRALDEINFENGAVEVAGTSKKIGHRVDHTSRTSARARDPVRVVNHDHHGPREESPKRVDFSKTHQLREVNWDGTYQDSLAYQTEFPGNTNTTNSTITNSRDIRETDIHFLNFAHHPTSAVLTSNVIPPSSHLATSPPFAPPPSASNSISNCHLFLPPSSPATSSSSFTYTSVSSSSTSNNTDPPSDVRWLNATTTTKKPPKTNSVQSVNRVGLAGKSTASKNPGPKLTHVELQTVGPARAGHQQTHPGHQQTHPGHQQTHPGHQQTHPGHQQTHPGHQQTHPAGPSLTEQRHQELFQVRKHVEEKWTGKSQDKATKDRTRSKTLEDLKRATASMDSRQAEEAPPGGAEGYSRTDVNSPRRPRPVKMSITADLKEDEIILKLKERLKHQRVLASISTTSGSNDTSLTNTSDSSSAPPPALPPRHPLTNNDLTPRLPVTRKVAASHPSPSYKGFSEATGDHTANKQTTKTAGAKKKTGGALKKPVLQPKKHDIETLNPLTKTTPPPAERPKKAARVVAEKKSSKPGAKNIITTSSWRAGQELVMKELGMVPKVRPKSSQNQGDEQETHNKASTEPRQNRQPDGAEAANTTHIVSAGDGNCNSNEMGEPVVNSRVLSEDAKNMLNDLQLGVADSNVKVKSPVRPAVKRKAPKEPEKQQPCEKARHYDQESVRKFIAAQKANRLKKQMEEKMANKRANEKKQQVMHELAERQKKQAMRSAAVGRGCSEGERKRRRDGQGVFKSSKDKHDEHDDESTLTGDSGDDSTPLVTPRDMDDDVNKQRKKSKDVNMETETLPQHSALNVTMTIESPNTTSSPSNKCIEFKGQRLNLDVDSVLDRFSQVVSQRRQQDVEPTFGTAIVRPSMSNPTEFRFQGSNVFAGSFHEPETAFTISSTNSIARTNEERKQAIKATALTLQNRLAEERRKLEEVNLNDSSQQSRSGSDVVTRYNRIAGHRKDYAVFTSNLPGAQPETSASGFRRREQENDAATRIQAAYRGHNVRQALNWELPSGNTLGHVLRGGSQVKTSAHDSEEESTATSTFSEITATEASDGDNSHLHLSGNRRNDSSKHQRYAGSGRTKPTPATYKPPSEYSWSEVKADPYSVMSVFSRQSKYLAAGSRQADMPQRTTVTSNIITTTTTTTSKSAHADILTNLDLTSLKQPVITSTEQVMIGQTSSGQPIIAKARYTRVEATVDEQIQDNSDLSVSDSPKHSHHKTKTSLMGNEMGSKSEPVYSLNYESDESVTGKDSSKKSIQQRYAGQTSDAGVETDVSQMSEEEPRILRSKLETQNMAHDRPSNRGAGDGRLSPNSLANKFSASLNYLEGMEESLRQVVGMERTRGIALAQQESVTLAQVLKARQQEHNTELRHLQLQAQKEAVEATHQLGNLRSKPGGRPSSSVATTSLLEKEDNLRPESRSSRSNRPDKDDLSLSPGNRRIKRSSGTASLASLSKVNSTSRTSSVKTAEDSRNTSNSSIRTASDAEAQDSHSGSVPEEIMGEESYSMSFDETDEESFRQVLPSESHRKELRRQSGEFSQNHDSSSHQLTPLSDLSSLFAGEDSFNKFTVEMVRQIMREEEYRAQHQAALLSLREKALHEKAKAELAWLQQLKQKPLNKGADDVFPNLDKKEKKIRQNLQQQQAEIRRLQEANKLASKERQMLLQQHEEIAKIKQNTHATLQKLKTTPVNGRLARPTEVHTEDETEPVSDVRDDVKDSKSDSEMYKDKSPSKRAQGEKKNMEKQQMMRLDLKYMTAREQKLHERKKQAKELLEWKKRLDAEEQKVYMLEKKAIEAWGSKEKKKEEVAVKKVTKLVTPSKGDDSNVISNRILSSIHDELDGAALRSRTVQGSISEVISTQLSMTETVTEEDVRPTEVKTNQGSPLASGSEGSIPEEVVSGTREEKQKADESGDDTLVNSLANEEYPDTFEQDGISSMSNRRKSPVGRLLPQGNSPLPSPWSRKTGSESESEDSISHTETLSDASDYEVRIRQLSDELRRRRKEVEILKKERSRRQKEKLKAQEEALKKQLDAYNNYIQQLKLEKDELEHEPQSAKAVVKPQIKQPKGGHHAKTKQGTKVEDASNSSSFEDARESSESNQTSPDLKVSPTDEKTKKKVAVSLMDRISEGSESQSDKSSASAKVSKKGSDASEKTNSSSVQEVIEEVSQHDTNTSEKTSSAGLQVKVNVEAVQDKVSESLKDEDASYSFDFSDIHSSLGHSHSKVPLSARSHGSARLPTEGDISEQIEVHASTASESSKKSETKAAQDEDDHVKTPPTTGIQESDSDETESRVNSYQHSSKSDVSSRPSSERSVGSMSYPEYEEEEDIMSSGSERTPVKSSQKLPSVSGAISVRTEEEISEHISTSLPSISDKQRIITASYHQDQDILNSLLGMEESEEEKNEDEDDKTPIATPREMAQTPVPEEEEENAALLMTDPLADFHPGDRVFVWGRKPGILRYKGTVHFAPGIWAGIELDADDGESDGQHEGKRYFTCPLNHGVMVPGNDITAEQPEVDLINTITGEKSPDESVTTTDLEDSNMGDTILPAADASMLHSTPVGSPYLGRAESEKPTATPVKKDLTQLADNITDHLTTAIVQDSIAVLGQIAQKKTPPAVSPKPAKKVDTDVKKSEATTLPVMSTAPVTSTAPVVSTTPPTITTSPTITTPPTSKTPPPSTTPVISTTPQQADQAKRVKCDATADDVMKSLLNEAITEMIKIKKRKAAPTQQHHINGDADDSESSFEEHQEEEKNQNNDSGLSLEPIQRPCSPVPDTTSALDRKALNDEMTELFGEYIDDDLGFEQSTNSMKPPPPYPGGDQKQTFDKPPPEEIPMVVPVTKEEITPIITRAVDIFWTNRRYGESLEGVDPPPDFLSDEEETSDPLTLQSRRSWKRMLFDLAGEIIRDVYKNEDKTEPPPWHKAQHATQKFFKGVNPPTTLDDLKPVVLGAVFKHLDINGTRKNIVINKWNIRKKKDLVDSVLSQELGEEEKGWVDYRDDELNLKMSLADSLFNSLLSDTVHTVNGIYQRRQNPDV
ncbi:centrosome-associated protein 350-like [Physella acuta]|uniref:centrosome-associated protein 350-like n=1 Tax=Physella acuta TaxID=109671 RepID=UPI0027DBF269|nr:centrosome-associated protein 350-like [Physella acuta]